MLKITVSPPPEDNFATNLKKKIITRQSGCKRLVLTGVSLLQLNESKRADLFNLIADEKIKELVLNQNNLGKISLEDWKAFCNGLEPFKLTTLIIKNNELYKFTKEHWNALDKLVSVLSLEKLSLQNNSLYALSAENFQIIINLIKKSSFIFLLSHNNWEKKMDCWHEVVNACPKNISTSESQHRFNFGEKTPAGNTRDNKESLSGLEEAAKHPTMMHY